MQLSPSDQRAELERVRQNKPSKFIRTVKLKKVRGFEHQTVEFRYPVTALIGTNGGGKSTILGAMAMAYKLEKPMRPAVFFPKAFAGDDSMLGWLIEYEITAKEVNSTQPVNRTARFAQAKWRRSDLLERQLIYIEIQRTVPAGELAKYKKFIGTKNKGYTQQALDQNTVKYAGAILNKDISNYQKVSLNSLASDYMFVGDFPGGNSYSQFHFGAGEASIIEMVSRIENADDGALILIEEIENGLHPVAVRLLVQYLQNVAKRKKLQIAFTTHSQDAVDELPAEAIWAAINRRVFNGRLDIESLRAITGSVPEARVVFVEDRFVADWTKNALGWHAKELVGATAVYPAGGYPNVLNVTKFHNENPTSDFPAVALVDGDMITPENADDLPDYATFIGDGIPEQVVFDYVYEQRKDLASLIKQRCLLSASSEDDILDAMEGVRNSACDPHQLYAKLSEKLGFSSSALRIREGCMDLFNERKAEFWRPIIDFVRKRTQEEIA